MIAQSGERKEVDARLASEAGDSKLLASLIARARAHPVSFALVLSASALEFAQVSADGSAARTRLKLFRPSAAKVVAFFFKRSVVPGSRDRYAYGAASMLETQIDEAALDGWLAFLAAGFHPDCRPADLRRAVAYEVPEDLDLIPEAVP